MDWGLLIIMILVIPFITFLPAIFVAGLGYGLYQAIRNVIRERKMATRKFEKREVEVPNIQ